LELIRTQLEALVRRELDERVAPETERHAGLLDRRMRLRRCIHAHLSDIRTAPDAAGGGFDTGEFTSRRQGDERRRGGRVGDETVECAGQAEGLTEPADDDALE